MMSSTNPTTNSNSNNSNVNLKDLRSSEDLFESTIIQLRTCHQEQIKQLQHQLFDTKKRLDTATQQLDQANQTIVILEKKLKESNEQRNLVYKKYLDVQRNHDDLSTFKKSIVSMLEPTLTTNNGNVTTHVNTAAHTASHMNTNSIIQALHNSNNSNQSSNNNNQNNNANGSNGGSGVNQQTIASLTAGVADILERYEREEKITKRLQQQQQQLLSSSSASSYKTLSSSSSSSVSSSAQMGSKFSIQDFISPITSNNSNSTNTTSAPSLSSHLLNSGNNNNNNNGVGVGPYGRSAYFDSISRFNVGGTATNGTSSTSAGLSSSIGTGIGTGNDNLLSRVPQEKIEEVREELAQMTAEQLYNQTKQRLSGLEFADFARNIKKLNQQEQSVEETLRNVKQIFGNDKQHLFSQFQRLIRRGETPTS